MVSNFGWQISTASIVKIDEVQGTTDTSPKVGQTVTVEGVVVGDFQGAGQFSGYYLQEEDSDVDANPATSEGIFVFSSRRGEHGRHRPRHGTCQRVQRPDRADAGLRRCQRPRHQRGASVTPTVVSLPVADVSDLERYEGMRADPPADADRHGALQLGALRRGALSGAGRLYVPTYSDARRRGERVAGAERPSPHPARRRPSTPEPARSSTYPRTGCRPPTRCAIGDRLSTAQLDIGQTSASGGSPTAADRTGQLRRTTNPRPSAPAAIGGQPAASNLAELLQHLHGDGRRRRRPDCRGANTPLEFDRQWHKTVAAISGTQADVVAFMEMENDGYGRTSADRFLVDQLNDEGRRRHVGVHRRRCAHRPPDAWATTRSRSACSTSQPP